MHKMYSSNSYSPTLSFELNADKSRTNCFTLLVTQKGKLGLLERMCRLFTVNETNISIFFFRIFLSHIFNILHFPPLQLGAIFSCLAFWSPLCTRQFYRPSSGNCAENVSNLLVLVRQSKPVSL